MSDVHEDLKAAFDGAAKDTGAAPSTPAPASPPGKSDFEPQKSEVLPPVFPDAPPGQMRGPDGKFVPRTATPPAAPAPPSAPPATDPARTPTPPPGGPPAPAAAAPGAPAPAPGAGVVLDPSKPPSAWTPAMKAKWDQLPEDARMEITRREEASARGVAQLKQHYEPMEELYRGVIEQNLPYFEHIEREPLDYFAEMLQVEQMLALGNPAQKMQTLLNLADQYQIPLRQTLDAAMSGKLQSILDQAHQLHGSPEPVPPAVQRELQQLRQQQELIITQAADAELAQFLANNDKPFFEEVKDRMADLIEGGFAEGYQDAYDMAIWQMPEVRAKVLAQQNGQAQAAGIAQRQAAAAQVTTPGAAPVVTSSAANTDESIEDTVRKAWNQAASPGV